MSEWKEYKLGETCDIITGFSFKGEEYEPSGNLKVVRGENVTRGTLRWDNEKHWNKSTDKLEKYFLEEGDIVIGMDGSRIGQNKAIIRKEELPLILAQRVAKIKAKNGFSQVFLWYNIFSNSFKNYVESIHTGTSIPHISQGQIADFEILAPSYEEQKAIASVLSSLDNKIDLLLRQNQTLEAMAETLFRQWFIEEAEDSWEKGKLGDYIQTTSGGTPSRANVNFYENGNIRWVKSKELNGTFIFDTEEKITDEAVKKSSAKLIPANSVLIAMYGATIGQFGILAIPATCNQAICALIPNEQYPYSFLYIFIKFNKEYIESLAMGSAQQNISQVIIKDINILTPNDKIVEFHKTVEPSFLKIKANISKINTLTQLRDTLLPKLMSGQVRVSEK